ncbi:hypothetical protein ZIOFF_033341 [Zingiber officinale]|uniref:Rubisco LSMT substrate-binding domain-containing protein n=1 Tax=Zingiber officinale TaxID=94328 RepID=A0A8J5GI61_ZINOF|nr:hypothetical protein ZIOFF_033341 [Zingiber officinale]
MMVPESGSWILGSTGEGFSRVSLDREEFRGEVREEGSPERGWTERARDEMRRLDIDPYLEAEMRIGVRVARSLFASPDLPPPVFATRALRSKYSFSVFCPEKEHVLVEESANFLQWLRGKTGTDISSVLALGNSTYGSKLDGITFLSLLQKGGNIEKSSLIALKNIKAGDCILKVPYLAQITSESLSSEIEQLLPRNIGNVSWVAIVLLAEKKLRQSSEWFTYLNCLPCMDEMHNAIFWRKDELKMICKSPVYQETISQQAYIEKEFSALRPVLEMFPDVFGKVHLENFMHAYALVSSRAWETSKGVSLIPFADFLNHDCKCGAVLLSDVDKEISEVIADRDYAIGEQDYIYGRINAIYGCLGPLVPYIEAKLSVYRQLHTPQVMWSAIAYATSDVGTSFCPLLCSLRLILHLGFLLLCKHKISLDFQVMIRYGKFSNATLLLDFGFTLQHNLYDQVQLHMDIPLHDPLYATKTELVEKHCSPRISSVDKSNSTGNFFIIKLATCSCYSVTREVKSASSKGKGIPQALRAFVRILSATSIEELQALLAEAAENDGRLARRPLKSKEREVQAHHILCSRLFLMIEGHNTALKMLNSQDDTDYNLRPSIRTRMAVNLLSGELRIMQSAYNWLENYCKRLSGAKEEDALPLSADTELG